MLPHRLDVGTLIVDFQTEVFAFGTRIDDFGSHIIDLHTKASTLVPESMIFIQGATSTMFSFRLRLNRKTKQNENV